ncbi:MAG: YjfB family protein [Tepidisphaerales bacterium]
MDVSVSSASAMAQSRVATEVGYAVQRKVLGIAKAEGAALLQMLRQAAQVGQEGGTDPLSAAATGKGGRLDVYA